MLVIAPNGIQSEHLHYMSTVKVSLVDSIKFLPRWKVNAEASSQYRSKQAHVYDHTCLVAGNANGNWASAADLHAAQRRQRRIFS